MKTSQNLVYIRDGWCTGCQPPEGHRSLKLVKRVASMLCYLAAASPLHLHLFWAPSINTIPGTPTKLAAIWPYLAHSIIAQTWEMCTSRAIPWKRNGRAKDVTASGRPSPGWTMDQSKLPCSRAVFLLIRQTLGVTGRRRVISPCTVVNSASIRLAVEIEYA